MAYRFKQRAQFIFPSIDEELVVFNAELTKLAGVYQVSVHAECTRRHKVNRISKKRKLNHWVHKQQRREVVVAAGRSDYCANSFEKNACRGKVHWPITIVQSQGRQVCTRGAGEHACVCI